MEIRIGVLHAPREVVIESAESAEAVKSAVDAALATGNTLELRDEKGRVVLVPAAQIAYVDIAAAESRRIGFGGVAS